MNKPIGNLSNFVEEKVLKDGSAIFTFDFDKKTMKSIMDAYMDKSITVRELLYQKTPNKNNLTKAIFSAIIVQLLEEQLKRDTSL